jgi:hypothetical protein
MGPDQLTGVMEIVMREAAEKYMFNLQPFFFSSHLFFFTNEGLRENLTKKP